MKRIILILLVGFSTQIFANKTGIFDVNHLQKVALDTPKVDLPFPIYDYQDYTERKKSPISLTDPDNIDTDIVYNPETDGYEIVQKIGGRYYRYPTSMTREEYLAYQRKKAEQEYWGKKVADDNEQQRDPLVPSLKVKGEAFDMIFGGDEINIRPQGTAQLQFGVNVSRYDNPAFLVKRDCHSVRHLPLNYNLV